MISIYFAPPGVGKSTLAARFCWIENLRRKLKRSKYDRVLCNFPCSYSYEIDKLDIGEYDMSRSLILVDECSVDYNNRRYKDLTDQAIRFFKYHRKYSCDMVFFSQSYNDMDVTIRRLCVRMYLLKRCWFWPYCTKALRITKTISIDETTHDIVDAYEFDNWFARIFTTKRYYMPLYWHMFDSWDAPKLPIKRFKWNK